MRKLPKRLRTGSTHPEPDNANLSEVLGALAVVTREEKMRRQLMALARNEETSLTD